ncbi:MAG TPA: prepilin peptidase [Kofleriaceae bacterium]|nr:prepilin peptidase [Kofleriaceae bacterium]
MHDALSILATSPAGYVFAVVLGLLFGSFANVCIYRWPPSEAHPHGRSVVRPGSHCFACGAPIRWYDNVPLASYLWLRGRCRACKAAFSPRYLLVEALTGALFGVAFWFTLGTGGLLSGSLEHRGLAFLVDAAFVWVMVVVTFIDLDHKLILNKLTIPSMIAFYGASLVLGGPWWGGLVGAAIGYGVPWLIGELYLRLRKREGLGLGDGMLLAVVGALLGWRGVVIALFGGSVIGSVLGIAAIIAARRKAEPAEGEDEPGLMTTELPFGPFLALAAVFYLFGEPWIQLHFTLAGG